MSNFLFPIFLKLEDRPVVIIGGGKVALEKIQALLDNSPQVRITVVAKEVSDEIKKLNDQVPLLMLKVKAYETIDLQLGDLIISAVNDIALSERISREARSFGKLVNAADKPELCDFYLGSIVKKGNLKIAISTNGKSPTMAKRLKEMLASILPDEIDQLLINLHYIRTKFNGSFQEKIIKLNAITDLLKVKD